MKRLACSVLLFAFAFGQSLANLTGCYLCRTKDFAVFLKLTQSKSKLSGMMQVLSPNSEHSEPDLTEYDLVGNAADSTFSLLREDIDTSDRHIIGTASKDLIKLSVPASDGSFAKLDMRKGTLESLKSFARTYSSECATQFNRRVWRGRLMQWIDEMASQESSLQQLVDSATMGIESGQKKVNEIQAALDGLQKNLADAKQDIDQKTLAVSKLQTEASRLDKEMQENWSAQVQHQFQDAKAKLDASAADLKAFQDKANQTVMDIEVAKNAKEAAEKELASSKNARESASIQLKGSLEIRRMLRETGFSKHVRKWKPDKYLRARIVGTTSVYMYPDPSAQAVGTLFAPTIVDVLPLDGDWRIIRYQGTYAVWIRAKSLKML